MADNITYSVGSDAEVDCPGFSPSSPTPSGNFTGGCLNESRWAELRAFVASLDSVSLVFGLNLMYGRTREVVTPDCPCSGDWDPSNTRALLEHTVATVSTSLANVAGWELGNEIECLDADKFARDVLTLRSVVDDVYGGAGIARPKIIVSDQLYWEPDFFEEFIPLVKDAVDVISWHDYPLGAGYNNPSLEANIMDPAFHDTFIASAGTASGTVARLGGAESVLGTWMGETGGCYNSGHYNVSNAFMDAFWYLESLAGFARGGASGFCRQTLVGGNYELVDKETLEPNPDFYAAMLFSELMGSVALKAVVEPLFSGEESRKPLLRAWAHCKNEQNKKSAANVGGVVLLLLNYGNVTAKALVGVAEDNPKDEGDSAESDQRPAKPAYGELYMMTGVGHDRDEILHSRRVKLNGQVLSMGDATDPDAIPALKPALLPLFPATTKDDGRSTSGTPSEFEQERHKRVDSSSFLASLPPWSYAFVVVPYDSFPGAEDLCNEDGHEGP